MTISTAWVRLRTKAVEWLPYPMAAPETKALRKSRMRIMSALCALAAICLLWGWIGGVGGAVFVAVIAGLVVFLAIQVPIWVIAKNRADDAWLARKSDDA